MSNREFLKVQTYSLKVNIHCEGCKRKVKKILQKIEGIYIVKLEAEWGKVTVSGEIESETLIRQLNKRRKHAQLVEYDLPDNEDIIEGDDDVIDGDFGDEFGGGSPPQGVSCLPQATAKIPITQSFPCWWRRRCRRSACWGRRRCRLRASRWRGRAPSFDRKPTISYFPSPSFPSPQGVYLSDEEDSAVAVIGGIRGCGRCCWRCRQQQSVCLVL